MLVFRVLQLDLGLLLYHRLLIQILEHQVLQSLPPDFYRDVILLLQILMLAIFVSEFSLFVLKLLLYDEPEIVDSKPLIVILSSCDFLLFNGFLESTALVSHRLLVLLVIVVYDLVGQLLSSLLSI